jgi:AcrR family transcriptional regulator
MTSTSAVRLGRPRIVHDEEVFQAMSNAVIRSGLPRLSVNGLAADLGVTPAALRQRFGSKAGLVRAFHDWSTQQLRTALTAAETAGGTPLETLDAIVRASVPALDSPARVINALSMLTDPSADDESRAQVAERLAISREHIAILLSRAMDAGELDPAEPRALAARLQEALIGACIAWALQIQPADTVSERVCSTADGILAPLRTTTRRTDT